KKTSFLNQETDESLSPQEDKWRKQLILHSTPLDSRRGNFWLNPPLTAPQNKTAWGKAKEEIKFAAFSTKKILQGVVNFMKGIGESMAAVSRKGSHEDLEVPIQLSLSKPIFNKKENITLPQPIFNNKENIPPPVVPEAECTAASLLR
ncbi:unnamed protein product, partial [Meganyctiphanes norvegica]